MRWLVVITAVAALLFSLFPEIDLWFSGLFYEPGAGFVYRYHPLVLTIHRIFDIAPYIVVPLLILLPFSRWRVLTYRQAVYLLLILAIGPGLLVNSVLKEHWGRARPGQVVEFGGTKPFTPALLPTNHCEQNCSFTSGHAAMGFYFMAFAMVARTSRQRRFCIIFGFILGTLAGLGRILEGGHFLSDVVFSGIIIALTTLCLRINHIAFCFKKC